MVMEGEIGTMKQKLLLRQQRSHIVSVKSHDAKENADADHLESEIGEGLQTRVQNTLQQSVSELLKVPVEDIDMDAELSEYGFDSITFTEFANTLNRIYTLELMPTLFFEHPTLRSVSKYLVETNPEKMSSPSRPTARTELPARKPIIPPPVERTGRRLVRGRSIPVVKGMRESEAVAIVGMSGRFPKARDLNEFWENLLQGRDCITEIPRSRWDWREYYGDPRKEANKTNIKWGGFIDGIEAFDPLFFKISPGEAMLMDPQQRLLMLYVWKAIEDAGYAARDLSGTDTAIFVGTGKSGYNQLMSYANVTIGGQSSTGTS